MAEEKNTEKRMGGGVGVGWVGSGWGWGVEGLIILLIFGRNFSYAYHSLPYDHDSVSTMIYPSDTLIRGSSYSKILY